MDHGKVGAFWLLKCVGSDGVNVKEVMNNIALRDFFVFLAGYVTPPRHLHWRCDLNSRIDLLACCVASDFFGKELVLSLEELTHVNWAADTCPKRAKSLPVSIG